MSTEPAGIRKIYGAVFLALVAFTALTTAVAFVDLGGYFNLAVALTIAVVKATLVALYFMHLRYSARVVWVFVGAGFFWFLILVVLTFSDIVTRDLPRTGGL